MDKKSPTTSLQKSDNTTEVTAEKTSLSHRASDMMAKGYGSWWFIFIQIAIMVIWMAFNSIYGTFDPFPFVLLNLVLAAISAMAAPIILMEQNRSSDQAQERNEKILASLSKVLDVQTELIVELRNEVKEDTIVVETEKDPETLETEITVTQG